MGKISSSIDNVKNLLKNFVTAENSEQIAQMSKALDEVENVANTMETENVTLKDKIVDMTKGILFTKEEPKDVNSQDDTPKSIDEIMLEEAQKIERQNNGGN